MILRKTDVLNESRLSPNPPAQLAHAWRAAVTILSRDPARGAAICAALARIEWRWAHHWGGRP